MPDCHASVRAKPSAIDEIDQLTQADGNNCTMILLEFVVVLFIIEIMRSFLWH